MNKPIEDYMVVVGNAQSTDLESYKLFNIRKFRPMSGRIIFEGCARDVNVHRNVGLTFWNFLLGKPTIVGGLDLDRLRSASFDEKLVLLTKEDVPRIVLAFPDNWEELPREWKENRFFGSALRLAYLEKQSLDRQRELLVDAGLQQTEIMDKLAQSQSKTHEYIQSTVKGYLDAAYKNTQEGLSKGKKRDDEKKEDYLDTH